MVKEIKASHPFHSAIKGKQGGSLPSVHNSHIKACSVTLDNARQKVAGLKFKLPNPVSRIKGA